MKKKIGVDVEIVETWTIGSQRKKIVAKCRSERGQK